MGDDGWATVKAIFDIQRLRDIRATIGDIRFIANLEGGAQKSRVELSDDGRCSRCSGDEEEVPHPTLSWKGGRGRMIAE